MSVKLLAEQHLEFLSLKAGCAGSPESTRVKMPHCWKTHVMAQIMSCLSNIKKSKKTHFQVISDMDTCRDLTQQIKYLRS